jgi:hypothetical protein
MLPKPTARAFDKVQAPVAPVKVMNTPPLQASKRTFAMPQFGSITSTINDKRDGSVKGKVCVCIVAKLSDSPDVHWVRVSVDPQTIAGNGHGRDNRTPR